MMIYGTIDMTTCQQQQLFLFRRTVELRTALQGPTMGSRLSARNRRQSLVAGTVFSGGCFFLL